MLIAGLVLLLGLGACKEKPPEVVVTETREVNTSDGAPKLMATSQERFRGGAGAPTGKSGGGYSFTKPAAWQQVAATDMRLLNFTAGEQGAVEIYLSETGGGMLENVGRWFRQFAKEAPTQEDLTGMPRMVVLGGEGILVQTSGTFSAGFGRPEAPGFALAGVIGQTKAGVLTVKMVGPEAAVQGEMEAFRDFCASLQPGE
ncbi:MAG: hypothetical protein O3A92_11150 [Verrucomicrobia bacterium]|nr:hypothetical protein [Verrucomicrobiota bacterium]